MHRLRFPEEKARNRRYYAVGFYIGSLLIVGGPIGLWARWCLGNRDPWLWVIFRIAEGKNRWSRPALLLYWAFLCIISVAGWNRQLARSRRFRPRNPATAESTASSTLADVPYTSSAAESINLITAPVGITFPTTFPNIPSLPNGANMSHVAADLLDAADKHVPTLGLNARRKFFHGLAVVMFIPGVAMDVSEYTLPMKTRFNFPFF
jgi:dolichol kinase